MDDRPAERNGCPDCPIEGRVRLSPENHRFGLDRFKTGEIDLGAGAGIVLEGAREPNLFALARGVAFRHKSLADGRRQILGYAFPGDFLGLRGALLGEMQHSIDAMSAVRLCVFDRAGLLRMFATDPGAAYAVVRRAAKDESILDENLLSIGRRTALESAAYLLALLHQRARPAGLAPEGRFAFPLTQQHVADTLGLSIVHINRTLKRLAELELIAWLDRGCVIRDEAGLLDLAGWTGLGEAFHQVG